MNIKGRAKGTSAHEVIFELEVCYRFSQIDEFRNCCMISSHVSSFGQQATGAVLVSREPNKVILYRGWREGEAPPGELQEKKDVREGSSVAEDKKVSPKLMEATRGECALSTNRVD